MNFKTFFESMQVFLLRDALERVAGVPAEKIVEAHGTLHTSHCINSKCNKEYNREWMTGIATFHIIYASSFLFYFTTS